MFGSPPPFDPLLREQSDEYGRGSARQYAGVFLSPPAAVPGASRLETPPSARAMTSKAYVGGTTEPGSSVSADPHASDADTDVDAMQMSDDWANGRFTASTGAGASASAGMDRMEGGGGGGGGASSGYVSGSAVLDLPPSRTRRAGALQQVKSDERGFKVDHEPELEREVQQLQRQQGDGQDGDEKEDGNDFDLPRDPDVTFRPFSGATTGLVGEVPLINPPAPRRKSNQHRTSEIREGEGGHSSPL